MKSIDIQNIQHIALFRMSALGDVTMMVPVVRCIQRAYPHIKISWITSQACYELLSGLQGIDFLVIKKPRSLQDYKSLRAFFKAHDFDVLLAAQASLRANLIYPLIRAPLKIGFGGERARDGHRFFINYPLPFVREHLLEGFLRFAKILGVQDLTLDWDLPLAQEDWQWARQQLGHTTQPWLLVNPMASKPERCCTSDLYAEVIRKATQTWSVNIVLTGGNSATEMQMSQEIINKSGVDCLNLTGKTTLKQLAAVIGLVQGVLAPDTGPLHIANALGIPVVGLYAVARPELSGPFRFQHLVVNQYPLAVKKILHKDAEKIAWGKRVHHAGAMQLIDVASVLQKLVLIYGKEIHV